MAEKMKSERPGWLSRRRLLAGAGAIGAATAVGRVARAEENDDFSGDRSQGLHRALRVEPDRAKAERIVRNIIGGRVPREGVVHLSAPDIAENGAAVPFTIRVACAMTEDDYPVLVHLVALENPFPEIAEFRFTPACGEAEVTGRCRMRASAPLVVVAEMSDGSVAVTEKEVEVMLGACG